MRLSNRDETIAKLNTQIAEMQAAMGQGEARLMELYADQERWETERAGLEEDIGKKVRSYHLSYAAFCSLTFTSAFILIPNLSSFPIYSHF